MEMNHVTLLADIVQLFAYLFVFLIGIGVLWVIAMYIIDVNQTTHAIRRNFPVVGRFRYMFEHLGEFFRQYFFAQDREEMPFNRAERSWAYRAAKGVDTTVAFGSTRDLKPTGSVIFVNCPFPTLDQDAAPISDLTIGEGCDHPYTTNRVFHVSGMSYGALSKPAVLALSNGARMAGCWMNTGEGGLSEWHLQGGADIVFQIGTAKYGVRDEHGNISDEKLAAIAANDQVKMFEIKLSQGAKPGKGGILPAVKVTPEIAKIRNIPVGEASISPNGHPEIRNSSDLLDMIARVRRATCKPVGCKMVIGTYDWLHELFGEICQRGLDSAPDFITVDSGDGGSGAAPQPLIDNVGLLLRESLPLLVDLLNHYGLRQRIKVIASGKAVTPEATAAALCAGADFVVSARGFLFALGCIQALQCNRNTCPTGITTHNKDLQRGLVPEDKARRVQRYQQTMEKEVGIIAHSCGVKEARQFKRSHCRIVQNNGRSKPMDEVFPNIKPRPASVA